MNTETTSLKVPVVQSRGAHMREVYRRYGIVAALIVLCIVLSFANQYFLTVGNIADILRQTRSTASLLLG